MPARKANRQSVKREARNRSVRTANRTVLANAARSIESGDTALAEKAALVAIISLDRAVQKGVIHKNTASRRKSRLSIKLNRLQAGGGSEVETPAAATPRRRAASSGGRQTRSRTT